MIQLRPLAPFFIQYHWLYEAIDLVAERRRASHTIDFNPLPRNLSLDAIFPEELVVPNPAVLTFAPSSDPPRGNSLVFIANPDMPPQFIGFCTVRNGYRGMECFQVEEN